MITLSTRKRSQLFTLVILLLGAGTLLYYPLVKACAARPQNIAAPLPYFPPGAVWTEDISQAPLDPRSSVMINGLADAGGWGHGRMQIDFSLRVVQADAGTPSVPTHQGRGFYFWNSDIVPSVPLPAGGGIEGQSGYECPVYEQDCHLIVADRAHNKLYEAWQATYTHGALDAAFLAVWDLSRVYPPTGRGDQCTSADAAGFPIAPLLFNADELATGNINHAI